MIHIAWNAEVVILGIFLLILLLGVFGGRIYEKRTWNNGICKETGLPWVNFDTDSQGGRGYKSGDHFCWISYNVDRIKTPKLKSRFQLLKE